MDAIRRMIPVNPRPGQRAQLWYIIDGNGQYIEDEAGEKMMFTRSETVRIAKGTRVAEVIASRSGADVKALAAKESTARKTASAAAANRRLERAQEEDAAERKGRGSHK